MWIKICGNTNLEDAQLAAELGANALGFVFAASKRHVTAAQVAAITPHLPPAIERVGVFQNHSSAEIIQTVRIACLTAVQLHGSGSTGYEVAGQPDTAPLGHQLREEFGDGIRIIQGLHWAVTPTRGTHGTDEEEGKAAHDQALGVSRQLAALAGASAIDRVLIDSRVGSATGGTGVAFDWTAARTALSALPPHLHLILAGGLNPENVTEAIRTLHPWGVDAVSGVEASPGHKDAKKLAAFIRHARA